MKSRITVLTLGVNNFEKSFKFYKDGPGFKTDVFNPALKIEE